MDHFAYKQNFFANNDRRSVFAKDNTDNIEVQILLRFTDTGFDCFYFTASTLEFRARLVARAPALLGLGLRGPRGEGVIAWSFEG